VTQVRVDRAPIFNQIFVAWTTSFATFLALRCGGTSGIDTPEGSDDPGCMT